MHRYAHPIFSCKEALAWERQQLVGGDEAQWAAMRRAGAAIAGTLLGDAQEIGGVPPAARILVLAGKGHNAGDALLVARELLATRPQATVTVLPVFGERAWRPLAFRAWQQLLAAAPDRVERTTLRGLRERLAAEEWWDVCLDGILGLQFHLPLDADLAGLLAPLNEHRGFGLRVAIDLPTGVGEEMAPVAFRADFTYAAGIVKEPALRPAAAPWVGRLRYADIGFFAATEPALVHAHVLTPAVLDPLRALRPPQSDKRTFGHLLVVAGSRSLPGAALMTVQAALRSGVGLVTALVPESLAAAFTARAPEAMWVPVAETPEGGLALEGLSAVRDRLPRFTAIAMGPGLGPERETQTLVQGILSLAQVPVLLDADALQRTTIETLGAREARPVVLTPHAGELARLRGASLTAVADAELIEFARERSVLVALKGPLTRIGDGRRVYYSLFGGPVLARGGSGDVLSGLIGGCLAAGDAPPTIRLAQGLAWHGLAADRLARHQGSTSATATDLLAHLAPVLREAP